MHIEYLRELSRFESDLSGYSFTRENSPLAELNQNFVSLQQRSFYDWLTHFSKKTSFAVMEIGGGQSQKAAIEIADHFPHIKYYAVEKRKLINEAKKQLDCFPNFHNLNMGFGEVKQRLYSLKSDIVFAHNVARHLPHPFFTIEEMYSFLSPGGVLFCNDIPIYENEWEKTAKELKIRGFEFNYRTRKPTRESVIKGITMVDFTILNNGTPLTFPLDSIRERLNAYGEFSGTWATSYNPQREIPNLTELRLTGK